MSVSRKCRRAFQLTVYATSLTLAVLMLPLITGAAFAQGVDIPAILDPDLKAPPTAVTFQYGHQFKVDVEDAGTEIARDTAFFSVAHRTKLSEKTSFFALGSYTLQNYNFSSNSGNAYQWDDVHRLVVGGLFGHDLNDRWRLIGGGIVRSWGEGGADYGKSITGGLIGGFDYHPNEDFSIGLIIGAFSALEDSMALFPVPTMKWKFAEDWKLHVGMVSVIDPGVGAEVSWQISDTVSIGTGVTYQSRRYRLDSKTRVPGTGFPPTPSGRRDKNGIGQETEVPVFAMVQWKPTPKSSIDLLAGVAFAGNIRVESNTGGYISDDDYDPAPFVGLKGTIAF
jgi:hypothetical protein